MNCYNIEYDLTVVGGGPAGLASAISAARLGAKVLLVEKNGFLGGNMTLGLPILGFLDSKGRRVVGGFAQEFVKRLADNGGCLGHRVCPKHNSVTNVDPVLVKILSIEMCRESGVDVLLHLEVIEVVKVNEKIKEVVFAGKGNRVTVTSKLFIDATGDGDLAFLAGCSYETGQSGTSILQPPTVLFAMENVDTERLYDYIEQHPEEMTYSSSIDHRPGYDAPYFRASPNHVFVGLSSTFAKLKDAGILPVQRNTLIYIKSLKKGEVYINSTRLLNIDATDIFELTRAELEGSLQSVALAQTLKKYVPGFEESFISYISPDLGVRETRRFKGIGRLCEEDVVSGKIDMNSICLGAYPIDIHSGIDRETVFHRIDKPYGIPFQALLSSECSNLIFAGRCISMDAVALASARVMAQCLSMGMAAGIASSIAIKMSSLPKDINILCLRKELLDRGAILTMEQVNSVPINEW